MGWVQRGCNGDICYRNKLLFTTLFKVISQWQRLNMLLSFLLQSGGCSSDLIFRPVFNLSGETVTVNFTAFWVRPCGWWLGTPSCKRGPIMHSAHSCCKVIVFHSGLRLNPILILSTQEGERCLRRLMCDCWKILVLWLQSLLWLSITVFWDRSILHFIFISNITIWLSFLRFRSSASKNILQNLNWTRLLKYSVIVGNCIAICLFKNSFYHYA